MSADPKIARLAALLIDKYGNDALDVVADRAAWRLAVREYRWAALWALVAETIRVSRPDVRPASSIWHAPVPLHDLLHDPIMDIVVQDDEGRRHALRETLRDAGRRVRERDAGAQGERGGRRPDHP